MNEYFLGIDARRIPLGQVKAMLILFFWTQRKESLRKIFPKGIPMGQLDDTFDGHGKLFEILSLFVKEHSESIVYAGIVSKRSRWEEYRWI